MAVRFCLRGIVITAQRNSVLIRQFSHCRLLLGVKFDDELFFEREVDVFSLGKSYNLCGKISCVSLEPLRNYCCFHLFCESLELFGTLALFLQRNNVALLADDGRNVNLLAVESEVCVTNELTSFLTAGCETHSVYDIVESEFEKCEEVFTCYAFLIIGDFVVVKELLFLNTVVTTSCLLFSELETVFLYVLTTCSVLSGNCSTTCNCALICEAAVALEEQLFAFSAAELAGRTCISCHVFLSSLLYSSALRRTASVMRDRSYVFDKSNVESCCLESTNSSFASVAGTLYINFYSLHAVFHSALSCCFCCCLSCIGSILTGALEALSAGRRPCYCVALYVSDCNDSVVEGRADVCVTGFYIFTVAALLYDLLYCFSH